MYDGYTGGPLEYLDDMDSEEYKAVEKAVRKAVRLLLREGHPYQPSKLMRRPEVNFAQGRYMIRDELLHTMMVPYLDCRDWIWEEYAEKRLWNLDEAASLGVGMDPLIFELDTGSFNNHWREEREKLLHRTREAILLRELSAVVEGEAYHVMPHAFCRWALGAGFLTSGLTRPLQEFAKDKRNAMSLPTLAEMRERFINFAQQRLFLEGLSDTRLRHRALYGFAIYAKYDKPQLKREQIAKLAFESLNEDCQSISGFAHNTIRNDLLKLDELIDDSQPFLNLVPSEQELKSTDPTHRWWSRWRPLIASKLHWLVLPE